MLPDNEKLIYDAAQRLSGGLMNNNLGNVYPQMMPVLNQLGHELMGVFTHLLGLQRQELFFGESPWAKLYTIQTGRKIEVPDRTIIKSLTHDRFNSIGNRNWAHILDYFLANWDNDEGDQEWHFFLGGPTDYGNQVILNFDSRKASYHWEENDMRMELENFAQSRAALLCPLFHDPYDVDVEYSYIQRTLLDPLLAKMEKVWGIDHVEEEDGDLVISRHYYGTPEAPFTVSEEHNVHQLAALLNGGMFGKMGKSFAYRDDWNGYRLQFSTKRDWSCNPSIILKVAVMHLENDKDRNHDRTVSYWWRNPLLVADLKKDLDSLLQELVDRHELEMKEV